MKKPGSPFASLPEQDRRYILDLCAKHPYDDVVETLKKRRSDGGLEIATSSPALCRFYTRHVEPSHALLAQSAAAANIRHEQQSNAFLGAILSSIQARVFESLSRGKALADLHHDFKLLKTAQNLYLADAQWRANNPKAARAAYQTHVDRSARAPEFDFMTIKDLARNIEHLGTFCEAQLSDFDRDVLVSREHQRLEAEEVDRLLAKLGASGIGPRQPAGASDSSVPDTDSAETHSVQTPAVHPESHSKSPVIPHIPPDSTSAKPLLSSEAEPSSAERTTQVPYLRIAPKIGRNDPCPCGSGRKYKKCCVAKSKAALAA